MVTLLALERLRNNAEQEFAVYCWCKAIISVVQIMK